MAKNKSNKGMIFGTVLGAVAGAAYALWKTPMSGQELRGKLSPGPVNTTGTPTDDGGKTAGFTDKLMSKVEHTLAPIVGVDLGKTANSGTAKVGTTSSDVPTDVASPDETFATTSAGGTLLADPAQGEAMVPAGSDTIRMKKFAWGTPAPEADKTGVTIQSEEVAPVEPVADATHVPAADAITNNNGNDASGSNWTVTSSRSQRFAWGDPKPETTEQVGEAPVAGSDPAPEQREVNEPVPTTTAAGSDNEPVHTAPAAGADNVADAVMNSATSVSTGKMVPFPKLGGLENNS